MISRPFTETEGRRLAEDILGRLGTIEALTARVEERSPQTVLFHLGLQLHHDLGDLHVAALGADGIGLPVDLLDQEVQLPPHGLAGGSWVRSSCYATDLARLPDVLTITKAEENLDSLSADAQAHRLLVHRHLVGEDGRLGENPALIDGRALEHLIHPYQQLLPVLRHRLGGTLLHPGRQGLDGPQPAQDVRSDVQIAQVVVELKAEVEKIREQVQNIE
mgnify:CR=1 FL=1